MRQAQTMRQAQGILEVETRGRSVTDLTGRIDRWLAGQGIACGLATLFLQHTSASLTVQENADPDVLRDIESFLSALAPEDPSRYRHRAEGPDDMPAHLRSLLTQTSLTVPVAGGRLALGTWQAVYLLEHRRRPHRRTLVVHVMGE